MGTWMWILLIVALLVLAGVGLRFDLLLPTLRDRWDHLRHH